VTGPDVVLKTVPGVCGDNLPLRFGSAYDAAIVYDGAAEELTFQTKDAAGSLIDRVALRAGINNPSLVVNDPGADMDVRLEGDNDANLLFLDASVDRVGVGTATPGSKLTVNGSLAFTTLGAAADLNSQALTNANIDSGTVDGAVIGGASAAAGTFTTLAATGVATFSAASGVVISGATGNTLVVDTSTLVVDATNNRVGVGTDAPAEPIHILQAANGLGLRIQKDVATSGRYSLNVEASGFLAFDEVAVATRMVIEKTTGNIILGGAAIGAGTVHYTGGGGVQIGQPTGGNKGAGTLNAVAVYDDNVLLTDYVFEDGYKLPSIPEMAAFFTARKHLPTIPGREEWEKSGSFSVGQIATRLWETVEAQAIYISQLHNRLAAIGA
jgi:hypothetical protein